MMLFHGTTEENAKLVMKEGFKPDKKYNWQIKSKTGFVYLSLAYAPFYANEANGESRNRSLIKVEVKESALYPDEDYLMHVIGNPKYTQADLNRLDLENYKGLSDKSLEYLDNVSAKPEDITIIGCRVFDSTNLLAVCDPGITPINYMLMGEYYRKLTEWIYEGNNPIDFRDPIFRPADIFDRKA